MKYTSRTGVAISSFLLVSVANKSSLSSSEKMPFGAAGLSFGGGVFSGCFAATGLTPGVGCLADFLTDWFEEPKKSSSSSSSRNEAAADCFGLVVMAGSGLLGSA